MLRKHAQMVCVPAIVMVGVGLTFNAKVLELEQFAVLVPITE